MLEAIAIGDLHLDGLGFLPNGNELIMAEVAKAENYAVRRGIKHVFYLGDIANKPVLSYEAHELLLNQFSKHRDCFDRHIILGNHDFSHTGRHSLTVLKKALEGTNVHIYTEPTQVRLAGIPVNFLPYPYPNVDEAPDPFNCLNVSHFEVAGSQRDNGTTSSSTYEIMASTHWLMGHLHTPHSVGRVHYTGTLFQRNFGEDLPKSFSLVQARLSKSSALLQVRFKRIENTPAFTLHNLVIESTKDLDKIPSDPSAFCKLFVEGTVTLPSTLLATRPNIIRVQFYKTKSERAALIKDSVIQEIATLGFDVYEGLSEYLDQYYPDLSQEERERILQLQSEIKETLK